MNSNSNVSLQKKLRFELPDMKNNNSDTDTDDNVENKKYYEIDQYSEESSSDKYDEDSDMKLSDDSESEDNITDDDDDDNDDKNDGGDNDGDDNEDDDYNLLKGLKWVKADLVSNIPDFEDTSGLSKDINLPSSPSPMDFFSLFLTQDLIKYIIEQSNLYSIQQKLKIKPMDESELRKLIGFLFYGSVVQLPSKCDYWREQSRQLIISDNNMRCKSLCTYVKLSQTVLPTSIPMKFFFVGKSKV
ncbi:unnamed protein product [Rotaria magnacalcarata]|uniref:PiggyBac transposable element-derived protein domain-containing protein n=1 Tax=Rotaria magnacalcarata TaxID=392030 RepID=A0A820L5V6_9BILA|nr:unnamed protein product [Rotaria magnacalcarata]CAF4353998.1 unnamed protein product [Rotaria magnacalcarata]